MKQYTERDLKTPGFKFSLEESIGNIKYRCRHWGEYEWEKNVSVIPINREVMILETFEEYKGEKDVIEIKLNGYDFLIPFSEFKRVGLVKFPENWLVRFNNREEFDEFVKHFGLGWVYDPGGGAYNIGSKPWWIGRGVVKSGYEEVTFDELRKNVFKKTTMEKKIIGYKSPQDFFGGNVKAGTVYKKVHPAYTWYGPRSSIETSSSYTGGQSIPQEIVEKWEPVYEEEEIKIGQWLVVKDGKARIRAGQCQLFSKEEVDTIYRLVTNTEILADITIHGTKIDKEILDKIMKLF